MTTAQKLNRTYSVRIVKEDFWNDRLGKFAYSYKIISADDCVWDKGKPTLKACEEECKYWASQLKSIKRKVEQCSNI